MQFYFIRHGQSENNRLWALTGSSKGRNEDPDLTGLGWRQAEQLARFLAQPGLDRGERQWDAQNVGGFDLTHLYSSLMVRAVCTATVVAQTLGLPLVAWPDAHEVGGIHVRDAETDERRGLAGRGRSFFEEHHPHLILPESLDDGGWWNRPYETREERPERARRFVAELLARHGDQDRVAVISHGGFYNYVLDQVFDMGARTDRWFVLNNTGITRIDFDEERAWLNYANRVDFLPQEMIT